MNHQEAGQLGGLSTLNKYGNSFYSVIGAVGGRPKLRRLPAPKAKSNRNGGDRLPNRLGQLRELWKEKWGERCN